MSTVTERLALRIAHRWVAAYTRGLPTEHRDARRAEIGSDIWEHIDEGERAGTDDIGLEALARVVFGMPADVTWRIGQRRFVSNDRGRSRTLGQAQIIIPALAGMAVLLTLTTLTGTVAIVSAGVIVIALIGIVRGLVGSPPKVLSGTGAHVDMDQNRRRTTLLIVLAVSVIILTTTYAYAMSLDSWGDTSTVLFISLGWVSLAVGVVSLILLVADAIRARRS